MLKIPATDLGDLMTALTSPAGEVRRNPYHLTLPAWLAYNVRRGGELVGGQGGAAPDFPFATLYRLSRWIGGRLETTHSGGKVLGASDKPADLFPD
jgi:hypothetical protein